MSARSSLSWRLFRRIVYFGLKRAAGKVLSAHAFNMPDGQWRWLKEDFFRFDILMRAELNRLRPVARLEHLPRLGNRIMVELAAMTIASYRVLLTMGVKKAEARAVVADIGWIVYADQLRLASLPFRLTSRDPDKRLSRTIRLLLRFPFTPSKAPGYAVESWQEKGRIFTHFTHCPPQSFVRELVKQLGDNGELAAFSESWCTYDWSGADVIAGDGLRGHYARTKTLSAGDSVCDMCWKTSEQANTLTRAASQ